MPDHRRRFVATRLDVSHVMASAAIPALFPSVHVDEPAEVAGWYVDGATRRRVPLAPALELDADRVVVVGTGGLHPPGTDLGRDAAAVDLGDGVATLLGAVMDDPVRNDLRRLAEINALAEDAELAPALTRHREAQGLSAYRAVPYVAVAPEDGEKLARGAMQVFRANHGSLRRTLGDPDMQVMHRLLGSDSPLQGELLSYLMFDPDSSTPPRSSVVATPGAGSSTIPGCGGPSVFPPPRADTPGRSRRVRHTWARIRRP